MTQSVLIIGAGPVALTLAIELARYAIPVRIVEKMAQRPISPKLWCSGVEPWNSSIASREVRRLLSKPAVRRTQLTFLLAGNGSGASAWKR